MRFVEAHFIFLRDFMEYDNKKLREAKKLCKQLKKNISRLLIADINHTMTLKDKLYETESPVSKALVPKENHLRRLKLFNAYADVLYKQQRDISDIYSLLRNIVEEVLADSKTIAQEIVEETKPK